MTKRRGFTVFSLLVILAFLLLLGAILGFSITRSAALRDVERQRIEAERRAQEDAVRELEARRRAIEEQRRAEEERLRRLKELKKNQ